MMVILSQSLPLTEPVAVFTVLITAIFLSPFFFRILKIPDVAAFIITGIVIGPFGLNILARDPSIELLGTVGLLYIMFLIGLELDPEKLRISRRHSIVFGIFTFAFPFALGMIISRFLLKQDMSSSLFVSLMFSSHTLIAYPVVRKLGITGDMAVLTAIGGTIITDTLVLTLLSILTQGNGGQLFAAHLIRVILLFGIYLLAIFYGYPRISRWFFANVKRDRPVHFLFLILMVSISSLLAIFIGFEPIIGAFVAGMALSRVVPRNSMLMHHVDFVGNILFIPVFLIGTGMLINIRILFSEPALWVTFLILVTAAMAGKWLAAYFTQKSMGFSPNQRNLLFGLSGSRAAAAIAVMLIGFERNIIDEHLLDATVLIILVSCLAGSFLTDRYGKKMLLAGTVDREEKQGDIILVPISNPSRMAQLVGLSIRLQDRLSPSPVYVLNIIHDDKSTRENMTQIRNLLEVNVSEFNNLNESVRVITRVDLNVSSGILRAAKEYMVSDIILGWGGRTTASKKIFGSVFDQLYGGTQTLYVCNFAEPLEETDTMVILIPLHLEHEKSCDLIIKRISRLPLRQGGRIEVHAPHDEIPAAMRSSLSRKRKIEILHRPMAASGNISLVPARGKMHVLILPRKQSISYHAGYNSSIRRQIPVIEGGNFILIVPGFEY
jgi:Kef-type K+ transport system membrane component KefB